MSIAAKCARGRSDGHLGARPNNTRTQAARQGRRSFTSNERCNFLSRNLRWGGQPLFASCQTRPHANVGSTDDRGSLLESRVRSKDARPVWGRARGATLRLVSVVLLDHKVAVPVSNPGPSGAPDRRMTIAVPDGLGAIRMIGNTQNQPMPSPIIVLPAATGNEVLRALLKHQIWQQR